VIYGYAITIVSLLAAMDSVLYGTLSMDWMNQLTAAYTKWYGIIITNMLQ